ncbi:MAG: energy-coupling factor transporter transmembrane component T [Gemmatimonadota bacterium]
MRSEFAALFGEGDHARRGSAASRLAERLSAGALLALCLLLSALAFAARTGPWLAGLTAAEVAAALLLCRHTGALWRAAARLFLWQSLTIVALHLIRLGAEGAWPGLRISWQLLLAYLPGMVLLRSLPPPRLVRALSRVLPYRTAFVLSTCLRFLPLVLRQVRSIAEAQALRGARILPRDLLRPWHWPDLVRCVLVPAVIHSLGLAEQIALAARARDFGALERRTYYPTTETRVPR